METVLQYKCPCCGGSIEFDSGLQQMKCPYCDTAFDVQTLKDYDEALRREQPQEQAQWRTPDGVFADDEAEQVGVYTCQSCGGELVADETTAATLCPFCGSPVVLTGRLSGALKPDLVIPFRLDKQAAKEGLKRHLSGKRLLPKIFRTESHLDELKGVYVPFWLFDADAQADIRYRATQVRTWSDADSLYTETSHYALLRSGTVSFANIPVDGSSKMDDGMMDSLEPFDLSQAVDFQTAYLSGYFSNCYDVSAAESIPRADARVRRSTEEALAGTTEGYTSVTPENSSILLSNGSARYALFPVWLLRTSWRGKDYLFAMNGQTGKFVGDLPMDKAAYWRWWAIFTAAIGAVTFGLLCLLRLAGIL